MSGWVTDADHPGVRPSTPRIGAPRGRLRLPVGGHVAPGSLVVAAIVALLLLGLTSATAIGATSVMYPNCSSVRIRTGPGTTYATLTTLSATSRVTAVAVVSGGSYATTCGGSVSGSHWLKVTGVDGRSTGSLYGRTYVYAASSLFHANPAPAPTVPPSSSASPPAATTAPSPSAYPSGSPGASPSTAPSGSPSATRSPTPSGAPNPSASPTPTPSPTPAYCAVLTAGETCLSNATEFFGRGWGHGVGMSQYGAKGRATAGQTAATILAHYYAGTALGTMANSTVRVLVLSSFTASSSAPLRIYGRFGTWTIDGVSATFPADAELLVAHDTTAASGWHLTVVGSDGTVLFGGAAAAASFRIHPGTGTILQLYSKPSYYDHYRGILRVIGSTTGTVNVVNEVPMESYLRGVVGNEIVPSWPIEAVKAQAIASRSYAAYRLHPTTGTYDVYDDTRSQVYHGYLGEFSGSTSAVTATAGQVVTYKGAIADTLFHDSDGGWTENNENVFVSGTGAITDSPVPYLRGSSDRAPDGSSYDQSSPWATWHTSVYTLTQLQAVFKADSRTNVGSLVGLDLTNRGVSDRLISVTLIGVSGARKTVSGGVFISVFNANTPAADQAMMDTLFDVQPIP